MLGEIGRVAVFIICAQTLLHFRAKEAYEKYIKLLISMMVLLLLLTPFLKGGEGSGGNDFEEMIAGYEAELRKGVLIALEPEDVEEVMTSMAWEVVSQEHIQENEKMETVNVGEVMEGETSNRIQVEKIQIGD